MPTVGEITAHLESIAALSLQEDYDNSGLITGDADSAVNGVLIALDCTEEIIEEAIGKNCNMVISHHPLIFMGIKKLNKKNYAARALIKAIRNDVSVYAIHTNLDNIHIGVNNKICEKLGLKNAEILLSKKNVLRKLVVFVPTDAAEKVRNSLFEAGCGKIGNYDECSYSSEGTGTFRAMQGAKPFVGKIGQRHNEHETRIETVYPEYLESGIIDAMKKSHPYEEVAYDVYPLENDHRQIGSGMIGDLDNAMEEKEFLDLLKRQMNTASIRHTTFTGRKVKRVAVCGGSGSFLLEEAIRAGADFFVSADFKYHQFFDADKRIVIADIGHYESEQFTPELLKELLVRKFSTFAVRLTELVTNPVHYY